jgi:hypothetical protein
VIPERIGGGLKHVSIRVLDGSQMRMLCEPQKHLLDKIRYFR